ncbi:hypothetical protein D3C75_1043320 [compost metagenome]
MRFYTKDTENKLRVVEIDVDIPTTLDVLCDQDELKKTFKRDAGIIVGNKAPILAQINA